MKEDFLHYLWKFQKFPAHRLSTVKGESLEIVSVGIHNSDAGPDFFNSHIKINQQFWAGNVEIHLKSSDWYIHNHEIDPTYDAVILHVVWNHDVDIYRADNTVLPTLELSHFVDKQMVLSYQQLFSKKNTWINCENHFGETPELLLQNWLERLYFERLETKSLQVFRLLEKYKNDWEAVLFIILTKNFGLKVNGESFLSIAQSIDFSVIRKSRNQLLDLESLLLGQAGLLENHIEDSYYDQLQVQYRYLKNKFGLNNKYVTPVQFFRLRPDNFPTIRLVQLAALYHKHASLFQEILKRKSRKELTQLLQINTSEYWDTHYHFKSNSIRRIKKISTTFVDLILINTVAVLKFCYAQSQGKDNTDEIISLMQEIPLENNAVVKKIKELHPGFDTAFQSQALLQLKTTYCDKNQCLHCAVGNSLLQNK